VTEIYIPALRGLFGDWVYYSCIFPIKDLSVRVDFANEIHKSDNLSKLIQRELKTKRGKDIANYLETEEQRFFNSLVVAVYGGEPQWLPSEIRPEGDVKKESVSEDALNTLGFLRLNGDEKLFAIDGQHRLAGIKSLVKGSEEALEDEISVLLVAHKNDEQGLIRTRRLFTTLNKKAVVVSKGEIIALDENDIMAIISRKLIEDSRQFSGNRIAIKPTNNISEKDVESLTTIGNLYDVLGVIFSKVFFKGTINTLKYSGRPTDEEIEGYYEFSIEFFKLMFSTFNPLKEYSKAGGEAEAVKKYRGKHGGSVLFRPLGLAIVVELIAGLMGDGKDLKLAMKLVSGLELDLNAEPFVNTLWDPNLERINPKFRVLARDKLLVDLGVIKSPKKIKNIEEKYLQTLQ
jgi:DNA sulfur modification protein DndB